MATARRKTPAKGAANQQDPLILSGPPGRLRAEVTVANTGEQRLAIRGVTISRQGSDDVDAPAAALVPPGATASLHIALPMEPGTSPGDYPAEIRVAGLSRAAVLRVETELSMRITPRRLLAEPGSQRVSIVAVNDGNVDVPLTAVTRGRTSDGGKDQGADITLTLTSPAVLAPTASITLTGHLDVPRSLEPTRRHTASIPVGLADLEVVILPRKATPEESS